MSSLEYDWGDLRADACARFGDTPGPALEERILAVFRAHPQLVAAAIEKVGGAYDTGRISSGWPVLATEVEREAERAAAARGVKASGYADRDATVAKAERYLRRVGYLHMYEDETRDELFGRGGILEAYAADEELVGRMLALWREVRPIGERVEQEARDRAGRAVALAARAEQAKPAETAPVSQPV